MPSTTDTQVLFVSGEEFAAESLRDTFDGSDLTLLESIGGYDAIKRIEHEEIDCVITAASIPDMEVAHLLDFISDVDPALPVIVVGDAERPDDIIRAMNRGASKYLRDPDSDPGLLSAARRCAVMRRLERERRGDRRLNRDIVETLTTALGASSLSELRESIVAQLAASSRNDFVWLGEYDDETDQFVLYDLFNNVVSLDNLDSFLDCDSRTLFDEAIQSMGVVVTRREILSRRASGRNTPIDIGRGDDGAASVGSGPSGQTMSTAVVPLTYRESIHGVLVLSRISDPHIDGSERALLEQLGKALGRIYWLHDRLGRGGREQTEAFVRLLAHEIRNPLGVAMATVEQVEDEADEAATDRLHTALSDIDSIVDTFLSIAKSDGIDETTLRDFGATAEAAWTEVGVDSATLVIADSFPIEADHRLLARLFANLFQNAIRHGGDDVTVAVGVIDDGFYVEDDGPGIPPAERERVLQWGYSINDGDLGIGLSFVQSIVEAHEWDLEITDSDIGGARFEISGVQNASDPDPFSSDRRASG